MSRPAQSMAPTARGDGPLPRTQRRRERGVVLAMVLILALLLAAAVSAFVRRAVIDATLARNRDAAATAEALARGGVQIATFALLADLVVEADSNSGFPVGETPDDLWAQLANFPITTPEGGEMTIRIRDQGALVNLNALVDTTQPDTGASDEAFYYMQEFLTTVIDELPIPPGERALYHPDDLAANFLDWVDTDEQRHTLASGGGGSEDDYYQRQDPPYTAANGPLLSVDELRRIEGFDELLVDGIRPYVTVYPLSGGGGVNLNTAPPHVLKMVFTNDASDASGGRRIEDEDVRSILNRLEDGQLLCDGGASDNRCVPVGSVMAVGSLYPPAVLPAPSRAFTVEASVRVGDVRRTVEAVVDRSEASQPRILSWKMR